MNPYVLPNLMAFTLLLVLSLAVIFLNPRDKSNRLLFALCLNLALSVGSACRPGEIYLSHSTSALVKEETPCGKWAPSR